MEILGNRQEVDLTARAYWGLKTETMKSGRREGPFWRTLAVTQMLNAHEYVTWERFKTNV